MPKKISQFAKRIRVWRHAHDLDLTEAAKKLQVSRWTYINWEYRGHTPGAKTYQRVDIHLRACGY